MSSTGDHQGEQASVLMTLERIEAMLQALVKERTVKDWYTTSEVGRTVNKSEYTVREWCRLGRVAARKRACGRGTASEWIISHHELDRYRNEGLLPLRKGA